ncbi:MAG TPA: hypothetical protein VGH91_02755 [Gammaproteobacteria bacterium]|jgi:hypothetical protein
MRSRRSDGLWIVLVGLMGFATLVTVLPGPPAYMARVAAQGSATVTGAGTRIRTMVHPRRIPAAMRSDAAPSPRLESPV